MDRDAVDRAQKLRAMIHGYFPAQAIYVAARLNIADLLAKQSDLSIEELAAATACHGDALYRLLRALAAEGIFEERPGRRFALTPLGNLLRSDVPGTVRPAALIAGDAQFKIWSLFADVVKHGTPGFERVFRMPLFPFLEQHPAIHALFNDAMTHRAALDRQAILTAVECHDGDTIVDVGGGLGAVLLALLEKHPHAQGILLEAPKVIEDAKHALHTHPAASRLTFTPGDFLHAIPRGNILLLVTVVHMFQDKEALHLLHNCRHSLQANAQGRPGRLYIAEKLLRPANESDPAKWDDLNMMVMTGGKERTFEEYATLLQHAGFSEIKQLAEGVLGALA